MSTVVAGVFKNLRAGRRPVNLFTQTNMSRQASNTEMSADEHQTMTFRGEKYPSAHSLTCIRRLTGVPDEDAPVIGGAGEDVVVDGADGQTVDSIDVQEHVQGFSPTGEKNKSLTRKPTALYDVRAEL